MQSLLCRVLGMEILCLVQCLCPRNGSLMSVAVFVLSCPRNGRLMSHTVFVSQDRNTDVSCMFACFVMSQEWKIVISCSVCVPGMED